MDHYHHLSISVRESILFMCVEGKGICENAAVLGRAASTMGRELKKNKTKTEYSPSQAEKEYHVRRKRCCPQEGLADPAVQVLVRRLFLEEQSSPERISNRPKEEKIPFK